MREAIAQLRQGMALLSDISDQHRRAQRELDIVVTLFPGLISAKGYADTRETNPMHQRLTNVRAISALKT